MRILIEESEMQTKYNEYLVSRMVNGQVNLLIKALNKAIKNLVLGIYITIKFLVKLFLGIVLNRPKLVRVHGPNHWEEVPRHDLGPPNIV